MRKWPGTVSRLACGRVGRVPQAEGARLLKACDLYVSPHNTHMVDSRFFGSPTKIFEYMAMAGGIVASDLEQIGEVLSPALRVDRSGAARRRPSPISGRCSARQATSTSSSTPSSAWRAVRISAPRWAATPARRWPITIRGSATSRGCGRSPTSCRVRRRAGQVETGDAYKDQVQNQWNNNPVGSETAKGAQPHTLEWFLEVERYRHGVYAPWMPEVMEFAGHAGEAILEVGGGMGTDLAQFAKTRRDRHRCRSVAGTPAARAGELPAAGPDRPLRSPRRRVAAVRRRPASTWCTPTACSITRRTRRRPSPRSFAC